MRQLKDEESLSDVNGTWFGVADHFYEIFANLKCLFVILLESRCVQLYRLIIIQQDSDLLPDKKIIVTKEYMGIVKEKIK